MRSHLFLSIGACSILSALGLAACAPAPDEGGAPGDLQEVRSAADLVSRKLDAHARLAGDPEAAPHLERIHALRADLGLTDDDAFRPISVSRAPDGAAACRLQQIHKGVRVRHGVVISQSDASGSFTGLTSRARTGIDISTEPRLTEAEALGIVAADPSHRAAYAADPLIELVIEPEMQDFNVKTGAPAAPEPPEVGNPDAMPPTVNAEDITRRVVGYRLAYEIKTVEGRDARGEEGSSMRYLVDAHTGEIFDAESLIEHGTGQGQYSGQVSFNTLGTWNGGVGWEMLDYQRNFVVLDDDFSSSVAPNVDSDDVWGDGQPFTGASLTNRQTAMVDAIFGASAYWDLLSNVFQRQGPDDDSYDVNIYTHVGSQWFNASYSPLSGNISIGDGSGNTFAHPDVVAHEEGHALNDFTAGLSGGEAGGLNESSSDIFAAMAEAYRVGGGWAANATTIPSSGTNWFMSMANRNMIKPSLAQPASPDAWHSGIGSIEVHARGEPNNRAFYFLAQGATSGMRDNSYSALLPLGMAGVGIHKASQIWYRALALKLASDSTYADTRTACIQAAQELFGASSAEVAAVQNAYAGINVGTKASGYPTAPNTSESEPNNSTQTADWLSRSITPKPNGGPDKLSVYGSGADVDYFVYNAKQGEQLLIRLTSVMPYNYNLTVYDEWGSVVASSSNGAGSFDYVQLTGVAPWSDPTGTSPYYVVVTPVTTGAYSWYMLDVDFT